MIKSVKKIIVLVFKKIELGSAVAVRLTKYTGKSKEFIHPKHFLDEKPWFVKYIKRSDVVLDLGSGNGQNSIKAAKVGNRVVAVEIDNRQTNIAKSITKQKKLNNIVFKKGNLEKKLLFKKSIFDSVIFLDVLEHLENRQQILSEIHRILKPNGILFLGVPNRDTSWKKLQRSAGLCSFSDPDHKIEYSEKSIRNLLKKNKFKIINFGYGKFDTPLRGFYDIIGSLYFPIYKKISTWRNTQTLMSPNEASGFEIVAMK